MSGAGEKETTVSRVGVEPLFKARLVAQFGDKTDASCVKQAGSKCAEQRADVFDGLKFGRCLLTNEVHF